MGHGRIFVQQICQRILLTNTTTWRCHWRLVEGCFCIWPCSSFGPRYLVTAFVSWANGCDVSTWQSEWRKQDGGILLSSSALPHAKWQVPHCHSLWWFLQRSRLSPLLVRLFAHIWQWRGSPRWNGSGAPDLLDKFPIKTSEQSSLATSPLKSSFGSFCTCVLPKVAQQITSGCTFLDVHAIYSSVKLQEGVFCTTLVTFAARFQFHCPGYRLKARFVQLRVVL